MTGPTILPVDMTAAGEAYSELTGCGADEVDAGDWLARHFARHREQGEAAGREAILADHIPRFIQSWQEHQHEFFQANIIEIVGEFAEWFIESIHSGAHHAEAKANP